MYLLSTQPCIVSIWFGVTPYTIKLRGGYGAVIDLDLSPLLYSLGLADKLLQIDV